MDKINHKSGSWKFEPAHVLIVDDSLENRELLTLVLEESGLKVTTAENGKLALEALERGNFELAVMDVSMPVMDGYTAVSLMREKGMSLPVIALTAHAMKGAQERCLDAGYSGYLSKPIDFEKLHTRLAQDLQGTFVESSDVVAAPTPGTTSSVEEYVSQVPDEIQDTSPIFSSLSNGQDRYQSIILRFVDRLKQQIGAIEQALSETDYARLQDLGHWLRGSAGSVGFHEFDEPGMELEARAKVEDLPALQRTVKHIVSLGERVEAAYCTKGEQKVVPVETDVVAKPSSKHTELPTVVRSDLFADERYRPLVEKYVQGLPEQLITLEQAMLSQDFDTVADLAHWLLGSAGTLGLHAFTEPASDLQKFAKAGSHELAKASVEVIRALYNRIELSEVVEPL